MIQEDFFCKDLALNRRLKLRDNLLEHHDYEAVSKQVFRYLKKWYGVDYEIVRFLKKDPIDEDRVFLDLYPEKNSLTKSSLFLSKNPRLRNHSQEDKSAFQTGQSITLNTLNDNPNASREIDRKFFSQIPSSRNKSFGKDNKFFINYII